MTFPRVNFRDGVVYHDYHFNGLQLEIAREIKKKDLINYYDLRLIGSPYVYSFIEPAVDLSRCDVGITTARLDTNLLVITNTVLNAQEVWYSVDLPLPEPTSELYLLADYDSPEGTGIAFEVGDGQAWTPILPEQALSLSLSTLRVRLTLTSSGQARPAVRSYCLMWR